MNCDWPFRNGLDVILKRARDVFGKTIVVGYWIPPMTGDKCVGILGHSVLHGLVCVECFRNMCELSKSNYLPATISFSRLLWLF